MNRLVTVGSRHDWVTYGRILVAVVLAVAWAVAGNPYTNGGTMVVLMWITATFDPSRSKRRDRIIMRTSFSIAFLVFTVYLCTRQEWLPCLLWNLGGLAGAVGIGWLLFERPARAHDRAAA